MAQEPTNHDDEPTDEGAAPVQIQPLVRKAFGKARREFSEEELNNPLLIRTLLDDVDRLQHEASRLSGFEVLFHKADKKSAVQEVQLKQLRRFDILYTVMLTSGAMIFGFAPNISEPSFASTMAYFVGAGLAVGAIGVKAISEWKRK